MIVASVASSVLDGLFWAKMKLYGATTAAAMTLVGAASVPFVLPEQSPATAPAVVNPVQLGVNASLGGRLPFPDDSPWNQDVRSEPVDANSDRLIAAIGRDQSLFPSFGTGGGIGDYGRPLNPHNHAHVTGGSSSGSGAAVAAGEVDI